jgi:uncharacterized spore protein YtfJ
MFEEEENNMAKDSVSSINNNMVPTTPKKVASGSGAKKPQSVPVTNYQDRYGGSNPNASVANEGVLGSFFKTANVLKQKVIASVSPYVPKAVKQIAHNVIGFIGDVFDQWLGNNEETKAVIQEAKQEEANAATPVAKAAAKAKAGNAAKAQLKATLQIAAHPEVASKTQGQIKAATNLINALSDDEAVALFTQIDEAMQSAPNEDKFHAAAQRLDHLLKQVRQQGAPSKPVKGAATGSVGIYVKKQHVYTADREALTMVLKDAPASAENASQLNQISHNTEISATLTASITESAFDPILEVPQETLVQLHENIAAEQNLAVTIIQVAQEKGYKLDNFTQLASIAGVGGGSGGTSSSENAGVIVLADQKQEFIMYSLKHEFTRILQDVIDKIVENRKENERLDELASKKALEKKAYEQKMDELKQIDKKYVASLQDKKLADKLHANIIAASYMLKNPEQLSRSLIEDIMDEVNKIKWQIILPDRA